MKNPRRKRQKCLCHEMPQEHAEVWRRTVAPLPGCDCDGCRTMRRDAFSVVGCDCRDCTVALDLERSLWTRTVVNACDACGTAWMGHARTNVCADCWDRPLCRVCWRERGTAPVCWSCQQGFGAPPAVAAEGA